MRRLSSCSGNQKKPKQYVAKLERKYNKGKALGIFTHKIGESSLFYSQKQGRLSIWKDSLANNLGIKDVSLSSN